MLNSECVILAISFRFIYSNLPSHLSPVNQLCIVRPIYCLSIFPVFQTDNNFLIREFFVLVLYSCLSLVAQGAQISRERCRFARRERERERERERAAAAASASGRWCSVCLSVDTSPRASGTAAGGGAVLAAGGHGGGRAGRRAGARRLGGGAAARARRVRRARHRSLLQVRTYCTLLFKTGLFRCEIGMCCKVKRVTELALCWLAMGAGCRPSAGRRAARSTRTRSRRSSCTRPTRTRCLPYPCPVPLPPCPPSRSSLPRVRVQ